MFELCKSHIDFDADCIDIRNIGWYNPHMSVYEFVIALVMMCLIFSTINNYLRRKYGGEDKHPRRRARGRNGRVDEASSALLEVEQMKQQERAEARKLYERLAQEKLEVIKTALSMGYADLELKKLDERLERLVGPDKLTQLLEENPKVDLKQVDLMDDDLQAEIERLQQQKPSR
jgi:hypothetical protein